MVREAKRERVWIRAAERLVSLPGYPPGRAEVIGGWLADAFEPILPWEKGPNRAAKLARRSEARRRLREEIESKLPISLP